MFWPTICLDEVGLLFFSVPLSFLPGITPQPFLKGFQVFQKLSWNYKRWESNRKRMNHHFGQHNRLSRWPTLILLKGDSRSWNRDNSPLGGISHTRPISIGRWKRFIVWITFMLNPSWPGLLVILSRWNLTNLWPIRNHWVIIPLDGGKKMDNWFGFQTV